MKKIVYFFVALFCMLTILITDPTTATFNHNQIYSIEVVSPDVMRVNLRIVLSLITIFCFMGIFTEGIKETIEKNLEGKKPTCNISTKDDLEKDK